jgi:hypothetical protein
MVALVFKLRAPSMLVKCNHTLSLFAFRYFLIGSYVFVSATLDYNLSVHASHIAGVKGPCQFISWDRVSLTFCSSWPQTSILPISTSKITGIIDMSHCIQPLEKSFNAVPRKYGTLLHLAVLSTQILSGYF